MKYDIQSVNDIKKLVDTFYDKVKSDNCIGFFFSDVIKVNWDKHLPIMYDFWENILFHKGNYTGNPIQKHLDLHQKISIKNEHFQHWVKLFWSTVDELFEGNNAELIKQRAARIATVIQIKTMS